MIEEGKGNISNEHSSAVLLVTASRAAVALQLPFQTLPKAAHASVAKTNDVTSFTGNEEYVTSASICEAALTLLRPNELDCVVMVV